MAKIEPSDLVAQEQQEAQDARKKKLARQREIDDFRWLMGTVQGRRFVWRLLEQAGVFRTTFRLDSGETAFLEGNRNMGLLLINEVHALCPDKYQVMAKETTDNDDRS